MAKEIKNIAKIVAAIISIILLLTIVLCIVQYNSANTESNTEPVFINNTIKLKKYKRMKAPIEPSEEEEKAPPQSDVNVPEIG